MRGPQRAPRPRATRVCAAQHVADRRFSSWHSTLQNLHEMARRHARRGARNLTRLIARLVGWMMVQLCGKEFHDRPTKLRHLRRVHAVDSDAPHALSREFQGAGVDEQVTPKAAPRGHPLPVPRRARNMSRSGPEICLITPPDSAKCPPLCVERRSG